MSRLPPIVESFLDAAREHLIASGHVSEAAIVRKRAAMSAWFESNSYLDEWDAEIAIMQLPLPIAERLRRLCDLCPSSNALRQMAV